MKTTEAIELLKKGEVQIWIDKSCNIKRVWKFLENFEESDIPAWDFNEHLCCDRGKIYSKQNPLQDVTIIKLSEISDSQKWKWNDAVNAVREVRYALEFDCNREMLIAILKEAFSNDKYDYEKDRFNALKKNAHYKRDENKYKEWVRFGGSDLPTILLSDIEPKESEEPKLTEKSLKHVSDIFDSLVKLSELNFQSERKRIKDARPKPEYFTGTNEKPEIVLDKNTIPDFVKVEAGKWYKSNSVSGEVNKALFYVTRIKGTSIQAYGFDYLGQWSELDKQFGAIDAEGVRYLPAPDSEVTEALAAEAKKRGLVEGAWVKDVNGNIDRIQYIETKFSIDKLLNGGTTFIICGGAKSDIVLFENGIWATLVETLTISEAEQKLNCKIIK